MNPVSIVVFIVMVNDTIKGVFYSEESAERVRDKCDNPDEGVFARVYKWLIEE